MFNEGKWCIGRLAAFAACIGRLMTFAAKCEAQSADVKRCLATVSHDTFNILQLQGVQVAWRWR